MPTLYPTDIREDEIKLRVAKNFFSQYDTTKIIGNIDFCVSVPWDGTLEDADGSLVWGEAKQGNTHNIYHSFVQLILTIGKARTFDKNLPPQYLAAFDAEQFAFIPYHAVQDVFYQNDFNWNVTASDHKTQEFLQLYNLVEKTLRENAFVYNYVQDEKELCRFIRQNLVLGNRKTKRHKVNKNNFTFVYQRWCDEVKQSIQIDWDKAKKAGLLDADFFLAKLRDIISAPDKRRKLVIYINPPYAETNSPFKLEGAGGRVSNTNQDKHWVMNTADMKAYRYVVVELKAVKYIPEFADKLNFYVTAVDELMRGEHDNPTVGLVICKSSDKTIVEWSLKDIQKPLGVATYQLEEVVERTVKEIENRK
ncbi:MAG: DUF1016 family protein [Paludibacteraceae bacterium]|nr:DUF1016 family protein [Paludibacteraceae bacterium]